MKKLVDVSRELKKIPCESCGSKGYFVTVASKRCTYCDGKGWTEPVKNKEQLCSICKGAGSLKEEISQSCAVCDHKGYVLKIYEVSAYQENCKSCDGAGSLKIENGVCIACEGDGVTESVDGGLKKCKSCKGHGEVNGYICQVCNGAGVVEIEFDDKSLKCKKCSGSGKSFTLNPCAKCKGKGVLLKKTKNDVTPTS